MDHSAVTNPRRALIRRELEAGSQSAAQAPAAARTQQTGPVRFEKPYTEAERAMQAKKLAEMLRARQ